MDHTVSEHFSACLLSFEAIDMGYFIWIETITYITNYPKPTFIVRGVDNDYIHAKEEILVRIQEAPLGVIV